MRVHLISAALGMTLIIGCGQSSEPGGPGAGGKKPVVGQADNTFKLTAPMTETSIKQGETQTVTIDISRGTNFSQDVQLSVENPPKGLTITPASTTLKAGDKDAKVSIEAAKDAALGHHQVTVWGTPKEGAKTSVVLKIEVKAAG